MTKTKSSITDAAPTAPRGCTNFKLRQLLRRVSLVYDRAIADSGLKTTQYSLLSHVEKLGPITQAELAKAMAMDSSTLSRNLKPLQTAGWVAIQAGDDARSHALTMTVSGRKKRAEARALWKRAQLQLNDVVGLEDIVALHGLIDRISDALSLETDEAA